MTAPDPRLNEIQAIPTEAVEAAANVLWERSHDMPWTAAGAGFKAPYIREARAALEAAAPHMQAALLTELRKAHEALERVEAECRYLDTLADGDRYYAKVIRAAVAAAKGDERG